MANGLYDAARQAFLEGDLAWDTADVRIILVDTALYTVNLATHDFLDDVPGGARVAVSGSLTGKTGTAGVADALDVTFLLISGASIEAIIIYSHDGAADANRRLIAYIDTATGLPLTPNGGDIIVQWDNGANKIFKL